MTLLFSTARMIRSKHPRIRWIGWLIQMRRYVAFDWSRGPWPK